MELHHGDALEVLPKLYPGFDCCITDPPYSAAFVGHFYEVLKRYQQGANLKKARPKNTWSWAGVPGYWSDMYYKTNEEYESFTLDWMKLVYPLLLPGGFLAVFGVNKLIHVNVPLGAMAGFVLKDVLVWKYGAGFSRGRGLHQITGQEEDRVYNTLAAPSYEPILLFQKPLDGNNYENWKKHRTGMLDTRRIRTNVLEVPKAGRKEKAGNPHYSVKPVALLERLGRGLCARRVLDPFMGSGSTGEACKRIGAEFVGIELEKEFYDFAHQRILGLA